MVTGVTIEKIFSYREKANNHSMVLAGVIGENSTAALSFQDKDTAEEILSALKAETDVLEAAQYKEDGTLFGHYVHRGYWNNDNSQWFAEEYQRNDLKPAIGFNAPWFTTEKPVDLGGKHIGTIVLRIDLSTLNSQLHYFVFSMTLLSLVLLALATAVCMKLNQSILEPVTRLADTMTHVSNTGSYEVNVSKKYDDEIGVLVDGFNSMLEGIAKRDDELAAYRTDLQNLVRVRTAELEEANRQLVHEIEERKEIQRRLVHAEKMEAIGTLAGGVAHDLNNILSGVVTYPDLLLLQLPADSNFVQPLETIRDSGRRAAAIVQDLLTLARRGVKIEEVFDFQELITQYFSSLEFKELQKDHPLVHVVFPKQNRKFSIKGSPVHMSKTVMNLVSNAMEAIQGDGEIHVGLQIVSLDSQPLNFPNWRAGEYIQMTVADTGIGIESGSLERIFEPFFTTKPTGKGTGLGLASAYGAVEQHRGAISAYSEIGKGTIFHVALPLTEKDVGVDEQLERITGCGTILVVDDERNIRLTAEGILTDLGYTVILAENGVKALEVYGRKKDTIDLVILDMVMPEMSGSECFEKLRELNPALKIILSSGFTDGLDFEGMKAQGLSAFVRKPYYIAGLSQIVAKVLQEK